MGEAPVSALVREVSEEVGLQLSEGDLRYLSVSEHFWEHRHDTVHLFETSVEHVPELRPDNREIVKMRFVSPAEAARLQAAPPVAAYFSGISKRALGQ